MALRSPPITYTKIFINNEFVNAVSGKVFPTFNPANGTKIAEVAEGDKADVDLAVAAARAAFARKAPWRQIQASKRGTLIHKLANLIEENINLLSSIETLNNGKPFHDSVFDMQCAVDVFRYYAGWCDKTHGNTIPIADNILSMTRKEPVGVVGQIVPWNYPVLMLTWKVAPALAAGCTIVLKPAEQTPLTALIIAALTKEAGFPPGVFNVVPGYGPTAGAAISGHKDVDKVAFTGSTEVGRLIMEAAAKSNLKRVSLELGGKSPLVVFDDCDLDAAVDIAHEALFANHGQSCCAGSRTFVHEKVYDEFVKKAANKAKARVVGDPFLPNTQQGPQIDEEMFTKVLKYIESGIAEAKLETGGKQIGTEGYFVEPTVFSNVTDNMPIARDEIFGPVQSILKFSTYDELIERVNKTNYGLASGIITKDIHLAMNFAQDVQAGSVWINCYDYIFPQTPFGGYKQSGMGRDLGVDAVEAYLETKTITMQVARK